MAAFTAGSIVRTLGLWVRATAGRLKFRRWEAYLEWPGNGAPVEGIVDVSGWAFCRSAPVTRIEVGTPTQPPVEAAIGLPRPDVVGAYPQDPVGDPGFTARLVVTGTGPVTISVRFVAADGGVTNLLRTVVRTTAVRTRADRAPSANDLWSGALQAATDELISGLGRVPAVLDWTRDGLGSVQFRPVTPDGDTLPYLDHSIDVVVTDTGDEARLKEADRVAAHRVLVRTPEGFDSRPVRGLASAPPSISIVIPVHGRWDLTRACLSRVWQTLPTGWPVEVIVVNDGSTDETAQQLDALKALEPRLRVVRHETARGFGHACNSGAAAATGEIVVFLNNDTLPEPGWLQPMAHVLKSGGDAGAVGAQMVGINGWLQESGGAVFSDGSAWNLGRGSHPDDPLFARVRSVDYCSGAALATPLALFMAIGGFDARFAPAYYEDTDYCFAIRARGLQVYVQPRSTVVHLEGGTAGTDESSGVKRYQAVNRERFAEKWAEELRTQPAPREWTRAAQRHVIVRRGDAAKRVLVVAPTSAEYDRESGSRRVFGLLQLFRAHDWEVTFVAQSDAVEDRYRRVLADLGIEVWSGPDTPIPQQATLVNPRALLRETRFDLAVLHFWYLAEAYLRVLEVDAPETPVIVDSVDLHLLRHFRQRFVNGKLLVSKEGDEAIRELNAYSRADCVLTVSKKEAALIDDLLGRPGHALALPDFEEIPPGAHKPDCRRGLLLVGNFRHSPNIEALEWLIEEIVPRLPSGLLSKHPLRIVGNALTRELVARCGGVSSAVQWIGWVPEVEPYLRTARITLAPLRSGAGTKRKIIQSLMCGTPVVTTSIGAEGLDLERDAHALIADGADGFAASVVRLLDDDDLWSRLSVQGDEHARARHGRESAQAAFDRMLDTARSPRNQVAG